MFLFMKNYKHVDDICLNGFYFGTDPPVVDELSGQLEHLLIDHLKAQGLNDEQVEKAIYRDEKWVWHY